MEEHDPEAVRRLQDLEAAITRQEDIIDSKKADLKDEKKQLKELMASLRDAVKELSPLPLEVAGKVGT